MKYKKMVVIDHNELARAVELQYGLEHRSIDVMKLFYLDYAENGSHHLIHFHNKAIYFNKLGLEDAKKYGPEDNVTFFHNRGLVLTYLQEVFHDEVDNGVIIFIYW